MSEIDVPDRYELKYAIPDWQVDAVRNAILPFCTLDPYSAECADRQYIIQSIYFDTQERDLYRISRERRPKRFKVRIRAYGDEPGNGPIFLEVKNRLYGLVKKSRVRVPAAWIDQVQVREPLPVTASSAERTFLDKLEHHALEPTMLVRYEREAWVSTVDNYARVTFDRRIVCRPWPKWRFGAGSSDWLPIDHRSVLKTVPRGVVLELKCTLDVPRWMSSLIAHLGLTRVGVSKYCNGIERVWGQRALLHFLSYSA